MGGETTGGASALTRKDFISDQEVRWCPGCGDYAILAQLQKVLADLKIPRENFVFVSGIGCSSRLPYYVNTYGFHGIHGRAPAIATGIKCTNPDLSVWIATGDGDALAIGGNHFMHTLRRNVGVKILLFNNRIYGLTKGQYSPTSEIGKKTKSSPFGTIEDAVNPISLAIASGATFVARAIDSDQALLGSVLEQAGRHKGSAFVEIYQNCVIFNDEAFQSVTDRSIRAERSIILEHGKPLVFGRERKQGLRLQDGTLEIVSLGNGVTESDLLVHDVRRPNPGIAFLLAQLDLPNYPVPVGVFRAVEKPPYEELLHMQIKKAQGAQGPGDFKKLLHGNETWTVT